MTLIPPPCGEGGWPKSFYLGQSGGGEFTGLSRKYPHPGLRFARPTLPTRGRDDAVSVAFYLYSRSVHHGKYDGMSFDTVCANFAGRFSRNDITPSRTSADWPRE